MAIKLHVLIVLHCHIVAMAAQIIAGQINEHHMFGILLRVVAKELGILAVLFHIARALRRTGNRIDEGIVAHYTVVCLR